MVTTLELLTTHPFLRDLPRPWLERLAGYGRPVVHHVGTRLFSEGGQADRFWLIRDGRISLEFNVPGRGDIVIEQIGPGSVVGWSWMFPPYRWHFRAVAAEQTLSVELDGAGVRRLCEDEPVLGYELTNRFAAVLTDRLHAAHRRLVDLYAYPAPQLS